MDNQDYNPALAAEDEFKKSKSMRKGKLRACTRKLNDIKQMIVSNDAVGVATHLELFYTSLDEFKYAN